MLLVFSGFAWAGDVNVLPRQTELPLTTDATKLPSMQTGVIIPTIPKDVNQVLEIPIPEQFKGCWVGEVVGLDSNRALSFWPPVLLWQPKTYELCFTKRGLDMWQFDYAETNVKDRSDKYFTQVGPVRIHSPTVDGNMVRLHFSAAYQTGGGSFSAALDELSDLKCALAENQILRVDADVIVNRNDRPWREVTWHADFAQRP